MTTTPAGFTIINRDAGVLVHSYEFAPASTSTTFIARMENGQLLVISPSTGLTDEGAAELEEFGEVGAIVANNGLHHLGQAEWRARFPEARCFAAPETAARIKKKHKGQLDFEALSALHGLAGSSIHVREVPNTRYGETWCSVETTSGHIWYVSDVLANLPALPKAFIPRTLFKLTKSAPGFSVFHLALKFDCKDKNATLKMLLEDMEARVPATIVPAHGDILSHATLAADTRALIQAAI